MLDMALECSCVSIGGKSVSDEQAQLLAGSVRRVPGGWA